VSRCKDITKLISDSMERKLSLWQRIDLRTHLILCGFCRKFQANVLVLRKLATSTIAFSEKNYDASEKPKLSVEAKTRIRNAIRQQSV
jgi:hypothetical protein